TAWTSCSSRPLTPRPAGCPELKPTLRISPASTDPRWPPISTRTRSSWPSRAGRRATSPNASPRSPSRRPRNGADRSRAGAGGRAFPRQTLEPRQEDLDQRADAHGEDDGADADRAAQQPAPGQDAELDQ